MLFKTAAAKLLRSAVLILILLMGHTSAVYAAECAPDMLDIRTETGSVRFSTEVVDTVESRAQGLMFRESLGKFSGMLFVYQLPQPMHFWMRNTLIPLDMIFADSAGRVGYVHENAIPLDETPVFGGDEIQFVFEINGGMAKTLGITAGAVLRHPAISGPEVIWPCE